MNGCIPIVLRNEGLHPNSFTLRTYSLAHIKITVNFSRPRNGIFVIAKTRKDVLRYFVNNTFDF